MKRIVHMKTEGELMNYEIYTPDTQEKKLPMIVFLHGAGERGWNIDHLAKHGIPMMIKNGAEIPAVVLCPQCPANCVWDNIPFDVMALIEKMREDSARLEREIEALCTKLLLQQQRSLLPYQVLLRLVGDAKLSFLRS